jgi:hypothetical protein
MLKASARPRTSPTKQEAGSGGRMQMDGQIWIRKILRNDYETGLSLHQEVDHCAPPRHADHIGAEEVAVPATRSKRQRGSPPCTIPTSTGARPDGAG